jgi:hypothetical protein
MILLYHNIFTHLKSCMLLRLQVSHNSLASDHAKFSQLEGLEKIIGDGEWIILLSCRYS